MRLRLGAASISAKSRHSLRVRGRIILVAETVVFSKWPILYRIVAIPHYERIPFVLCHYTVFNVRGAVRRPHAS